MPVFTKTYDPRFNPSQDTRFKPSGVKTASKADAVKNTDQPPDFTGGTTYRIGDKEITQQEYNVYEQATDKGKFDFLMEKGIIPKGSQFVEGITQKQVNEINRLSKEGIILGIVQASDIEGIKAQDWGYYTPEQVAEWKAYMDKRPGELREFMAEVKKARERYELEKEIASKEAIDVRLTDVTKPTSALDASRRLEVLQQNKTVVNSAEYRALYIAARMDKLPDISDADKKAINSYLPAGIGQAGRGPSTTFTLNKSHIAYIKAANELSDAADKEYIKQYGAGAYIGSNVGPFLSMVFSPARALAPDVSATDISGMEWAIGGVQLALLATPVIGKGVGSLMGSTAGKWATATIIGGAGVVMTAETASSWNKMSNPERAVAVTLDTLVVVSAIIPLASAIRSTGKVNIIRSSQQAIKLNKAAYTAIDKQLGKVYTRLAKDQIKYANNIKNQYRMETMARTATNKVERIKFERQLAALQKKEIVLQTKLQASGNKFVGRFEQVYQGNIKGQPEIAESLKRLPNELPRQTKTIVMDSLTGGKAQITALKAQVAKLETELAALKNKYPTAPDKWGDVSADLQFAKSKLRVALAGNVESMQMRLQAKRDYITELKKVVANTDSDFLRTEAKAELRTAITDESTLTRQLKDAYNQMDAEWTQQPLSQGGVATATRVTPRTPVTGFGTGTSSPPSTATMTAAQLAALRNLSLDDVVTPERLRTTSAQPQKRTIIEVQPVRTTRQQPFTPTRPQTFSDRATAPKTTSQSDVGTGKTTEIMGATSVDVVAQNQPAEQMELKITPATKTEITTRTPTRQRTTTSPPRVNFRLPQITQNKDGSVTVPEGSVTWKQGIGWWTIVPPYRKQDAFFTIKKPRGATASKDMKSAFDTIQSMTGEAPPKIDFKMGIVNVKIRRPPATPRKRNTSAISFTQNKAVTQRPRNRKVGVYYISGRMISRKPIGRRK